MHRLLSALAVVLIILVAGAAPASAMTWWQFRINPSNGDWRGGSPGFGDLPYTQNVGMFGATIFWQPPGWRLGLRANIDRGSLSSWIPATFYDGGTWRYYDVALGVPVMFAQGMAIVFVGYGDNRWDATSAGTDVSRQVTNGWVFGADVWWKLPGPWYLAGSATLGPSHNYVYSNPGAIDPRFTGTASVSVYQAGIGFMLPGGMNSIEAGWRGGGFSVISATPVFVGDANIDGMQTLWSGWYLAFNVRK